MNTRYQVRYASEHAESPRGALFDTFTDQAKAERAAATLVRAFRSRGLRHEARSVRVVNLQHN